MKLQNPLPLFLDRSGALLDAGSIYVGVAGSDPEQAENQIELFWDNERTIPAAQPLRTLGGYIVNGANRAFVFMVEDDYALTIRDANGQLVTYLASTGATESEDFQPLDDDLSAIAAQGTTAFGRGLLNLNNQAALKSATGIPDALPLTGGTVSGSIVRQGAGVHAYAVNPAFTGFRLCGVDPTGAADATSQPGDFQVFY